MPIKNSFPTEFKLSDLVDLQRNSYSPAQDQAAQTANLGPSQIEDQKHINLLLCWAY
jgi:hypothetical protein